MFQKAERKKAKLRLAIAGTSGSGKTWSALEIATGMGGKIAMLDSESGRGELYGEDFNYDVMRIDSPYTPEKYIDAIRTAERLAYDVLIIDSLSHAWAGEGGILSFVDKAGGNSFTSGWKQATPKQNALVDTIISSKLHIIVTLRTKSDYVIEKDEKTGKNIPRKVGLAPVQREGLEYEFTVFMEISSDHTAHITKDNTKLFDQKFIKPDKAMGYSLMEWLTKGKESIDPFDMALEEIKNAPDALSLREIYEPIYKKYGDNRDKLIKIISAKDERKIQLEAH